MTDYLPDLSKYNEIFGKPNTGLHKYRIFNIAIVDVLATVLAAYIINMWLGYDLVYVLAVLFIVGVIVHRLFRVRTGIDKLIFP